MRIVYEPLRIGPAIHEDLADINALLAQLTVGKARWVSLTILQQTFGGGCITIARDDDRKRSGEGKIVGAATLLLNEKLTARFGIIEDVVVDQTYRGVGIGEELTRRLISIGKNAGLTYIDLTSNPVRVAANELYKKLGFMLRNTNSYRLTL